MSLSVLRGLRGLAASAVLGASALGVFSVSSAQASLLGLGACNNSPLSQSFQRWGDLSSYELAPGGDFEGSVAGWTLGGSAAVVPGSEPFAITGTVGAHSLSLPAGATAQSPPTCVNAAYPSFRFVASSPSSVLAVSVVYQIPLLGQMVIPVGVVAVNGRWSPTLPMLTASALPGLLAGGTAQVALRFAAVSGTSRIDDVSVDPHGFS